MPVVFSGSMACGFCGPTLCDCSPLQAGSTTGRYSNVGGNLSPWFLLFGGDRGPHLLHRQHRQSQSWRSTGVRVRCVCSWVSPWCSCSPVWRGREERRKWVEVPQAVSLVLSQCRVLRATLVMLEIQSPLPVPPASTASLNSLPRIVCLAHTIPQLLAPTRQRVCPVRYVALPTTLRSILAHQGTCPSSIFSWSTRVQPFCLLCCVHHTVSLPLHDAVLWRFLAPVFFDVFV